MPLLAQIPLLPGLATLADAGKPIVAADPASDAARRLTELARTVEQNARKGKALPILRG